MAGKIKEAAPWDSAPPKAEEAAPWDSDPPTPVEGYVQGLQPDEPGVMQNYVNPALETVLGGVAAAGQYADRYTGAPVRAAAQSLQASGDEDILPSLKKAAGRVYEAFGSPQEVEVAGHMVSQVPGWGEIYENSGLLPNKRVSDYLPAFMGSPLDVTPSGVAGMATGMATDLTPTYFKGGKLALKGAGLGLEALSTGAGRLQGMLQKAPIGPMEEGLKGAEGMATVPPTSIDEMRKVLEMHGKENIELPSAERLRETSKILPDSKFPPTDLHYEMLKSKPANDDIQILLEGAKIKDREDIARYSQAMKQESIDTMRDKAGKLTPDLVDQKVAGQNFMTHIENVHADQQEALGPLFQELQSLDLPKETHIEGLVNKIAMKDPDVAAMLEMDGETGKLKLKPNLLKSGLSDPEHAIIQKLLDDVNTGSLTFKDMQRIRTNLLKNIDPANPRQTKALSNIRAAMLDHMEELVHVNHPDLNVRETFKAWAKNERMLEDVHDMLGGKVGSIDEALKANPESVLPKIFGTSRNIKILRQHLPEEEIRKITGDYLNSILDKHFDSSKGTFQSAALAKTLKRIKPVLDEVDPELFEVFSAATDRARIVPDMAAQNNSGTGKNVIGRLKQMLGPGFGGLMTSMFAGASKGAVHGGKVGAVIGGGLGGIKLGIDKVLEMKNQAKNSAEINRLMGTTAAETPSRFRKVPGMIKGSAVYSGNREKKR